MNIMNRREILKLFAGALIIAPMLVSANELSLFNGNSNKNTINSDDTPYLMVGPYADDKYRIFMFISYLCDFCKQTYSGMIHWATTLPQPFIFVTVPLFLNDVRQKATATGFYIVKNLLPQKIYEYNQLVFEKIQSITSMQDVLTILKNLGLNQMDIKQSLNDPKTINRIKRAMTLAQRYQVTTTPFFGVAGSYTTDAGFTNGNYELLVQLLNGMISNEMAKNT